jgi:hypothetical protein
VFPETREQRCWFHKIGNVLAALPKSAHPGVKKALAEIWNAEDRRHALQAVKAFTADYGAKFPKAVAKITDDVDQLLAFYDYPAEHWVHLRTTNPIESTFATVRHRSKITKGPGSRPAGLAMAFKLIESAQTRWRGQRTPPRRPRPRRRPVRRRQASRTARRSRRVNSHYVGGQPAPDEHRRFTQYLHDLAVVRDEDEADLIATILCDPDATMAQSAVVRHLDIRAMHLLSDQRFTDWTRAMATMIGEHEFVSQRLREWTLLRSITMGQPWTEEDITTASDWFQRQAVQTVTSPDVLTLLAGKGRTRRVRAAANQQLHQQDRLSD